MSRNYFFGVKKGIRGRASKSKWEVLYIGRCFAVVGEGLRGKNESDTHDFAKGTGEKTPPIGRHDRHLDNSSSRRRGEQNQAGAAFRRVLVDDNKSIGLTPPTLVDHTLAKWESAWTSGRRKDAAGRGGKMV